MAEERNSYRFSIGEFEGNRPLEICRHRWDDNVTGISVKN
jgi:hypothetical protein